jgi:hypothetical protein
MASFEAVFKNPFSTSHKTYCVPQLMLFRKTISIYSGNHMKPINTLRTSAELVNVKASVIIFIGAGKLLNP